MRVRFAWKPGNCPPTRDDPVTGRGNYTLQQSLSIIGLDRAKYVLVFYMGSNRFMSVLIILFGISVAQNLAIFFVFISVN